MIVKIFRDLFIGINRTAINLTGFTSTPIEIQMGPLYSLARKLASDFGAAVDEF